MKRRKEREWIVPITATYRASAFVTAVSAEAAAEAAEKGRWRDIETDDLIEWSAGGHPEPNE